MKGLIQNQRGFALTWWIMGGILLLAILTLPFLKDVSLVPNQNQNGTNRVGHLESEGLEEGVTIKQVVETPQKYVGKQITVSAEVEDLYGQNAFTLDSPGLLPDYPDVLVLSSQSLEAQGGGPGDFIIQENDIIRVTGTVQIFDVNEIEQEVGIDLDDGVFAPMEGRPYIIAQSVERVGESPL